MNIPVVVLLLAFVAGGFSTSTHEKCTFYYQPGPNRTGPLANANLQWLVTDETVDTWTNYYGFDYYLSSVKEKRSDAKASCEAMGAGATLASVTSADENNFIFCLDTSAWQRYLGMKLAYTVPEVLEQMWDDGVPVTYGLTTFKGGVGMPWRRREPNNLGGNENCVSQGFPMKADIGPQTSLWNDVECTKTLRYVCKRPTSGNSVPAFVAAPTTAAPTQPTTTTIELQTEVPLPTQVPAPLPYCGSIPYAVNQWVAMNNTNYQYYTSPTRMNRYMAGMQCSAMGAKLTSIHSEEENRFLFCQHTEITRWIGLDMVWGSHRRLMAQKWVDKTLVDYGSIEYDRPLRAIVNISKPWAPGQPDFWKHNEYCVVQGSYKGGMGVWHDVDCEIERGFVCKKCRDGWSGPDCMTDIDFCAANSCRYGDCVEQVATANYSCDCKLGAGLAPSTYVEPNANLVPNGVAPDVGTNVSRTSKDLPVVTWTLVGGDVVPGNWQPRTDFQDWQELELTTKALAYVTYDLDPSANGVVSFDWTFTLYDMEEDFDFMFFYVHPTTPDYNSMMNDLENDMPTYTIATVNNTAGSETKAFTAGNYLTVGLYTEDSQWGRAVGSVTFTGPQPSGELCDTVAFSLPPSPPPPPPPST
jgi:hypothetical protein